MKILLSILYDPRVFVFVILSLNALSVIRFLFAKRWWDAGYWFAAFVLTFIVTFRPVK